uniref:Uncharacterized protein n=1 Tax=Strigamia maritima TaxID=126957 RepID=T1JFD1_STRMM
MDTMCVVNFVHIFNGCLLRTIFPLMDRKHFVRHVFGRSVLLLIPTHNLVFFGFFFVVFGYARMLNLCAFLMMAKIEFSTKMPGCM